VTNNFHRKEFTQEFRLNSSFSGPLNFTAGAFYENGELFDRVRFIRNRAYGFLVAPFIPSPGGRGILDDDRATTMDIKTWSAFGQLRYKIIPELELSAGARWTKETR